MVSLSSCFYAFQVMMPPDRDLVHDVAQEILTAIPF